MLPVAQLRGVLGEIPQEKNCPFLGNIKMKLLKSIKQNILFVLPYFNFCLPLEKCHCMCLFC